MDTPAPRPRPDRSITRQLLATMAALLLAASVAAGCGDEEGEPAELTQGGALQWLPDDTWLVATGDLSDGQLDQVYETLGRLPAWSLVEGELPAADGVGLRRDLLQQLATMANEEGGEDVSADELEDALGNRLGFAAFGDATTLDGDDAPVAVWINVDDEQLARDVAVAVFDEQGTASEHEGVTFYELEDADVSYVIRDELLLATTSPEHMRDLIDVRIDGGGVADDEVGQAVIDAGIDEAILGAAIATDPLLEQLPGLLAEQQSTVEGPQLEVDEDALRSALATDGIDDLLPDWVAGSITIDDVGLRMRGAWSNPRPIAEPDPRARELVERMPEDTTSVSAGVSDGTGLQRVQAAWADVTDATGLDLREQLQCGQQGSEAWACRLVQESLLVLLEDESLADAVAEQGDSVNAIVQDPTALLTSAASMSGTRTRSRAVAPAARTYEVVTSSMEGLGWTIPPALAGAMSDAGLQVRPLPSGALVVRVRAASPLGRQLRTNLDAADRQLLALLGIDPARLLSPAGLRIQPDEVGNLQVYGVPQSAPSKVVPALEGTAERRLGASDDYRAVVDAAEPPDEVGSWGWVAVGPLVEQTLLALAGQQPDVQRALPTVRNNLDDVPGMLTWTSREQVDGHAVGVAQAVLPVLE